jgi:selenocysteine lyase/cysteine desulfurase
MSREPVNAVPLDVRAIRGHFEFPRLGRVVTNNAASTQPPAELLALYASLGPGYENVHRGQSGASRAMTALFEESYDTIARFIGAPSRACIARPVYFGTGKPLERPAVQDAMGRITAWNRQLTARALAGLSAIPGITIYGPREAERRTSLVAFNLPGHDPIGVAQALDRAGIEAGWCTGRGACPAAGNWTRTFVM